MASEHDQGESGSENPDVTRPSDGPPPSFPSPVQHSKTDISDVDSSDDPLLHRSLGNFQVVEILGEGGFGRVYRAFDTALQRDVAIKYLKETLKSKSSILFKREAKALAALSKHPNIVTIHQWGEYEGHPYFVLEYIEQAADKFLEDYPEGLPVELALKIAAECADALQEAHDQGILHRDIKPANILLEGKNHHVKLADFGLARLGDQSESFTISNTLSGSPPYMSPEQAKGEPLDHRTDIFSLGVSLYQLLSGFRPYEGKSSRQILENVRNDVRIPFRERRTDLSPLIGDIVEKATAIRISDRIQTAGEFAEVLRDALESFEQKIAGERNPTLSTGTSSFGLPSSSSESPAAEEQRVPKSSKKIPFAVLGGVGAVGVLILLAILASSFFSDTSYPSRRDSASAKGIIDYYCEQWARENYEGMYHALYQVKQDDTSFAQWKALVQKEDERVSIPKSYSIEGPLDEQGGRSLWKVNITFINDYVGTLTKTTWVVKGKEGWRIGRGGLSGLVQNKFGPPPKNNTEQRKSFGPSR